MIAYLTMILKSTSPCWIFWNVMDRSAVSRVKIPSAPDKESSQKFRNTSLILLSEESSSSLPASKTQE